MNIATHKIEYMRQFSVENEFELKELPNGINIRNKDISFTLYSGSKGTYCINRFNGRIEKGVGFDRFKDELSKYLCDEYFLVDMHKALKMLFEGKTVLRKINDQYVSFDEETDPIAELFNQQLYGKKFSVDVNGEKFFKKEDAINFINRIGE